MIELAALLGGCDPAQSDAQDETGEAGVGNQQVAASAKNEERQLALAGESDAGSDIVFARRLRKPTGWTANLKGRVGRERYFLKELHFAIRVYHWRNPG